MNVKNWFLRKLAERELIAWKPEYLTKSEKESYDVQEEELRKLEAGEEIAPPLWNNPSWNNPARFVTTACDGIWEVFWSRLNDKGKRKYLKKHKPPPEDWYQVYVKAHVLENEPEDEQADERSEAILKYYNLATSKENKWLLKQKEQIESGAEIKPPWMTFPISLPNVGWDDGFLEKWKLEIWIPFWDDLNEAERKLYLEKYPPPDNEWKENITRNWTGEIRKTEEWFERQKFFLARQGDYNVERFLPPKSVFPKIESELTKWEEDFVDKWLKEIWLSAWNNLNDKEQDEYLENLTFSEEEVEKLSKHEVKNLYKLKG